MARNEYYVGPVSGDDSTGDGLAHGTAWKTVSKALSTISKDATDGDRINICDEGTDTLSASLPLSTYGNHTSRFAGLILEGYTSVAGDGGIFHINGGGYASMDESTYDYISFINGKFTNWGVANRCCTLDDFITFLNIEFDGTGGSYRVLGLGTSCRVQGCKIHNMSDTSGLCIYGSSSNHILNNYIQAPANPALRVYDRSVVYGNIFLNSRVSSECVELRNAANASVINNSMICSVAGTGQAIGNYGTGDANSDMAISNNYIEGWSGTGGAGISTEATVSIGQVTNNYYHNCTDVEDIAGEIRYAKKGPTTLANSGLVDWANGDWRPTKDLVGKSETTQFLTTGTTRSVDVGAVQRARGVIGGPNAQAGRLR